MIVTEIRYFDRKKLTAEIRFYFRVLCVSAVKFFHLAKSPFELVHCRELMSKRPIVVGNWKMHKTALDAVHYVEAITPLLQGVESQIFLAVPFPSITPVAQAARKGGILVGAQNMHDAPEGAFTGEVSGLMLKSAGASFVLLGHSERRALFGESDAFIHRKVLRALQDDLIPILCVGETWEEREEGLTEKVLHRQLSSALAGVALDTPDSAMGSEPRKFQADGRVRYNLMVAYEPVWAIGTGKSATPAMVAEAHAMCRKYAPVPLLYGGSVNGENASQIISQKNVDGVLVGGASLSPQTFAQIAIHCSKKVLS